MTNQQNNVSTSLSIQTRILFSFPPRNTDDVVFDSHAAARTFLDSLLQEALKREAVTNVISGPLVALMYVCHPSVLWLWPEREADGGLPKKKKEKTLPLTLIVFSSFLPLFFWHFSSGPLHSSHLTPARSSCPISRGPRARVSFLHTYLWACWLQPAPPRWRGRWHPAKGRSLTHPSRWEREDPHFHWRSWRCKWHNGLSPETKGFIYVSGLF